MASLLQLLTQARVYDLGQPYQVGMAHYPTHPPFLYSLTKLHGDYVSAEGVSSAADAIALGTHTGTHIDSLCHFSCNGQLFGGLAIGPDDQSAIHGQRHHSVDQLPPMVRRGLLLDIARLHGNTPLGPGHSITPEELDAACAQAGVQPQAGDVVLLRTGWAQYWQEPRLYLTGGSGAEVRCPGPELPAARWLSERRIFAAGSDTVAFERVPNAAMPVHKHLLVDSGIYLIEVLQLEDLARDGVSEFAFVAAPMRIVGATGAPLRPLAFVSRLKLPHGIE